VNHSYFYGYDVVLGSFSKEISNLALKKSVRDDGNKMHFYSTKETTFLKKKLKNRLKNLFLSLFFQRKKGS
jgi:hypothetical protein